MGWIAIVLFVVFVGGVTRMVIRERNESRYLLLIDQTKHWRRMRERERGK